MSAAAPRAMAPLPLALAVLLTLAAAVNAVELVAGPAQPLTLQIVHLNDFHARFQPVSKTAGTCKAGAACIGGLSRVASAIAAEREKNPDALVLNGGDNFQGTLWYSLFKWNATAHFMKEIKWDAMTIGNHEFDDGVAGVVPFLEAFKSEDYTVVANMDASEEPTLGGLYKPSTVVERNGHKIAIIGYIWKDTPTIARTEKLKFSDELEALDKEAERLKKEQDIDIVLALTHAGIEVDLEVAKKTKYADVIVGAHSHTLLYSGTPPSGEKAYGPYPEVVKQDSGRTVLVVQASAYTKYLGNITVHFDEQGEVASWEGNPIWMSSDLPQDERMQAEMEPWEQEVDALGNKVVGSTRVTLDKLTHDCYSGECTLGNFVTDAMLDWYVNQGNAPKGGWTSGTFSLMNAGGLRTNIEQGDITYGDIINAQPFANTIDLIELQGEHVLEALEDAVDKLTLLHWGGLHVVYDYAMPARHRVVSAQVLCRECDVPKYEDIQPDKWYTVVAPSFVIEKGDNFLSISDNFRNRVVGPVDTDVFQAYLANHNPVVTEMDGRLVIRNPEKFVERLSAKKRSGRTIFA